MDLRIISRYAKQSDLSLTEFARRAFPSKYYKDKKKAVMVSLIHLKDIINNGNLDLENAKKIRIPFVLCEGLESDVYTIRVLSSDWTVVEKLEDLDVPCSIEEVKEGGVEEFIRNLKNFRVCILSRCLLCVRINQTSINVDNVRVGE